MTARVERAVRLAVPGAATGRRRLAGKVGRSAGMIDPTERVERCGAEDLATACGSVSVARRPGSTTSRPATASRSSSSNRLSPISFRPRLYANRLTVDDAPAREFLSLLGELESHHGALRTLYLLSIYGELTAYQLRKSFPIGQRALSGALTSLDRAQLITARREKPFPYLRATAYRLSASGEILGAKLLEGRDLLMKARAR